MFGIEDSKDILEVFGNRAAGGPLTSFLPLLATGVFYFLLAVLFMLSNIHTTRSFVGRAIRKSLQAQTHALTMKRNIDLVNECDSFPYQAREPEAYTSLLSKYWELHLHGESRAFGYIPEWVVLEMSWDLRYWDIDPETRTVTSASDRHPRVAHNEIIEETLNKAREQKTFKVLSGWRNELYPIYGHHNNNGGSINMERAASPLFGINTYGIHLTTYVNTEAGMKIWVPRRSANKQTYGGMLDNTVAGGLATGEKPFNALIREAAEEASFPEELVRQHAKQCGTVSYFYIRDERAGGETGLLQPECQHVFDMEVSPDVVPKPNDDEVETFYLWTVEEVKAALGRGEFKPNCALVLLDFFVRHGFLKAENEPDYIEIVSRLHRRLPFPTS